MGPQEIKPIKKASNKGELIVNCVSTLVDEKVITYLPREKPNEFVGMGAEFYYQIGFSKYLTILDDMVAKLVDFNKNKENYPDPTSFKNKY